MPDAGCPDARSAPLAPCAMPVCPRAALARWRRSWQTIVESHGARGIVRPDDFRAGGMMEFPNHALPARWLHGGKIVAPDDGRRRQVSASLRQIPQRQAPRALARTTLFLPIAMSYLLAQQNIIVTGAFGTLGRAVWQAALQRGARLCLIDRAPVPSHLNLDPAQAMAIGDVDLADAAQTRRALDSAAQQLGGLDGLVNVAGGFQWQGMEEPGFDAWDRMYRMNLATTVNACHAVLGHLRARGRGRIVNVAAMAALSATAGMGAYAASKAGVIKLTEALASELYGSGIHVNAVLPSIIDTPQNRRDMPDADRSRWVAADDMAKAVMFFLGDDCIGVTGAALPVTVGRPQA